MGEEKKEKVNGKVSRRSFLKGAAVAAGTAGLVTLKALLVQIPAPTYRKRFDFYGVGQRVVEREWSRQFDIAFAAAMASAR